jgi:hypothetical protein
LEGWSGPHCEIRGGGTVDKKVAAAAAAAEDIILVEASTRQDTLSTIMIGCYLALIAAVLLNLVVVYIKFRNERKELQLGGTTDIGVELPSNVAANDGGNSNVHTEETKEVEDNMSDESKIV